MPQSQIAAYAPGTWRQTPRGSCCVLLGRIITSSLNRHPLRFPSMAIPPRPGRVPVSLSVKPLVAGCLTVAMPMEPSPFSRAIACRGFWFRFYRLRWLRSGVCLLLLHQRQDVAPVGLPLEHLRETQAERVCAISADGCGAVRVVADAPTHAIDQQDDLGCGGYAGLGDLGVFLDHFHLFGCHSGIGSSLGVAWLMLPSRLAFNSSRTFKHWRRCR